MSTPSPSSPGPLAGIKVLELGTLIAGPFCSRLLAEFGVAFDPVGNALNTGLPWAFDLIYRLAGHGA